MAFKSANFKRISGSTVLIQWVNASEGDTFEPVPTEFSEYADRSVQVAGTFGGAALSLQGSNDGSNFSTLSDPQGTALVFTSSGLKAVTEAALFVRPALSGGTGTSLTVTMLMRRGRGGKEI